MKNKKLHLPIRFIAESFHFDVVICLKTKIKTTELLSGFILFIEKHL